MSQTYACLVFIHSLWLPCMLDTMSMLFCCRCLYPSAPCSMSWPAWITKQERSAMTRSAGSTTRQAGTNLLRATMYPSQHDQQRRQAMFKSQLLSAESACVRNSDKNDSGHLLSFRKPAALRRHLMMRRQKVRQTSLALPLDCFLWLIVCWPYKTWLRETFDDRCVAWLTKPSIPPHTRQSSMSETTIRRSVVFVQSCLWSKKTLWNIFCG